MLFTGDSGSGKTTVMRLARDVGYQCYGDELAVCGKDCFGSWILKAAASTLDGKLTRAEDTMQTPIGLVVHLRHHLEQGFVIHPCAAMDSVVLGFRSIIRPGQHNPMVRASRFRLFSEFVREVKSVILDFAITTDIFAGLEQCVKE